ncbi:MAG TPA: hypothetical protein VE863_01225 [Pyrinomonadaceae bacterium]|nr:hypothetical protein [Pyrinomonadaceae bacterium]
MSKLSNAFADLRSDDTPVRRLITILVLPFPCWIVLSWFFTSFVHASGTEDHVNLSESYALWLGIILGVARVLGASMGKWLGHRSKPEKLQSVFEKAVFINVSFLFGASLLLVMRMLVENSFLSAVVVAPFLLSVAFAKGSEEVIKLSKNKFLASAVPNPAIRATTLSFVSIAQNAFGFVAISLGALVAFSSTSGARRQPVIIFAACASLGVTGWLVYFGSEPLVRLIRRRRA